MLQASERWLAPVADLSVSADSEAQHSHHAGARGVLLCLQLPLLNTTVPLTAYARQDRAAASAEDAEAELPSEHATPDFLAGLLAALRARLLAAAPVLEPWLRLRAQQGPEAPPSLPPIAWHPGTPRLAAASCSGSVHVYEATRGGGGGGAALSEQTVLAHGLQRQARLLLLASGRCPLIWSFDS